MTTAPRFSKHTLDFIRKASRQKHPEWLARNRAEYELHLLEPLRHLARHLKSELGEKATGYHFPQKGIGRLRRPSNRVAETGGGLYKNWISYSASRPSGSRFDHNPNLYFMIDPNDEDDSVLVAGGLYMASSRQLRSIREAIAKNAAPFDRLFASKAFAARFPGGFSTEKTSTRPPRGFDPQHPRLKWLKLQGFFVWRSYSKKEFASPQFASLVERDFEQILRLNELLDQAIQGRQPEAPRVRASKAQDLLARIDSVDGVTRSQVMDF